MFYELHTRSAYSFLSSGSQPQGLVVRAAELGLPGVALLDRDTVAGAVKFHFEAVEHVITPIKLDHPKGKHFATRTIIEEHSSDLLCFTGGADGYIHNSIKNRRGLADLAWLNSVFEKRLYVELQRHNLRNEEYINQTLLGYAHKLRLPYFASNGAYYADQQDRELFDVFTCIKNHCTIYDAGKLLSENNERHIKPEHEMRDLFEDHP